MTPKMTPEEALFLFNNMEFAEKYQGKDEYTEVTLVIKQALEKQIPKKPKTFTLPYSNRIISNLCPVCNNDEIDHEYKKTHCDNCGQKIDWSDTE